MTIGGQEKLKDKMAYAEKYKRAMVKKMLSPGGPSAEALSKRSGVSQATLSRWKNDAGIVSVMSKMKITAGRPDDRTPEEKLQLVLESSQLRYDELGEFLRRNGVHEVQLQRWKMEALGGLSSGAPPETQNRRSGPEAKEIRELKNKLKRTEKELHRKDKALAEAAALIVLKKKAEALWGDGENDTE
jgi:transposase